MEQLPSVGGWKKEMRGRKLKHTSSERRLDYNAPLLSVRRFNKEGGGGGGGASGKRGAPISSKLWKLSSELSAEPLRAPGAVPFEWEQCPGQPKQNKEEEEEEEEDEEEMEKKISFFAASSPLDEDHHHHHHHPMEEAETESISPIPSSPRAPMAVQQLHHRQGNGAAIYATVYSSDSSSSPSSSTTARDADDDVSIPPSRLTAKNSPIVIEVISASVLDSPAHHLESQEKDYSFSEAAETFAATTTTTGCRVSFDGRRDGGREGEEEEEEEQPLSHTGQDAREFIMKRFLPAAHAIASDAPQAGAATRRPKATELSNNRGQPAVLPRTPRQPPPLRGGGGGGGGRRREEEEEKSNGGGSMKACGFFSLRLRNAFGHINRSAAASKKPPPSPLSRRPPQEEAIYEDPSSGTDEEETVVREVKAALQERRSIRSSTTTTRALDHNTTPPYSPRQPTSCRGSSITSGVTSGGSFRASSPPRDHHLHHQPSLESEEADEPRFYDAPSRFGPQTPDRSSSGCVTPYRNGTPMSPFHEGRGFLGLPKEPSNDGGSRFETPRASVSDYKAAVDMDFCTNGDDAHISRGPKLSGLSQRFGKALWVDTGDDQVPGMHDMNDFGINSYHSRAAPAAAERSNDLNDLLLHHHHFQQQQQQESNNSRLTSPSSTGPVPGIFPANYQANASENKGWPLGISSYYSAESPCISPTQQKLAQKFSPAHVPSPPLPPSPSGSWLSKAVSSNASNPSPLSVLRTAKSTTKKKLEFSPTKAAAGGGVARWETMVKGSHVQPGHLRFSEELLHHSSNAVNVNKP